MYGQRQNMERNKRVSIGANSFPHYDHKHSIAVLKNEIGHRHAELAALTHINHADLCIIYYSSSTLLYQEVES
jgi:hypothetical protein